ncbi:MAG TPA: DUF2807 domain-containing protein [Mucilaginibacter sp.]|jgi:hypothetical protein
MKTRIFTLIALFVIMSGISNFTYAAAANHADYVVLNDIKAINKIEVRGNVELYISDNSEAQVKVYNKYYSESALVQAKNGVLRITSYTNEKLIVWVSTDNLRSISVYDNATVKSFGKLSKIEFNVDLHDNASAKLDLDAYSADVTVKDHAKIELSGNATEFSLNHTVGSTVKDSNFAAEHTNTNKTTTIARVATDDLTGLE